MKNTITFLIGLISILQVIGQSKFCGYVFDSNTSSPIIKATIFNPKNGSVSLSNNSGYYEYVGRMDDTLIISCIGYNQKTKVVKLQICDSTLLAKKINEQPIVVVSSRVTKKILIGYSKKKTFDLFIMSPGLGIVKYFNSSEGESFSLSKLFIETKLAVDSLESLIIKLVIYEASEKKELGKQLLDSTALFVINKANYYPLTLDIKNYDIQMPKNGVFVGIECIGLFDSTDKPLKNCSFGIKLLETKELSYVKYFYTEKYTNFVLPKKNKQQPFSPKFKLEFEK
jgi:CarboxypepD_reg-like domain